MNPFKAYLVAPDEEFSSYIKTKKDRYDYQEYITPEKLMIIALNKSELLLTLVKLNAMYLEHEKIFAPTSVFDNIKDSQLKLSNYVRTNPKKGKIKFSKLQSDNVRRYSGRGNGKK